ncbi:M14 family metallopeptidase [Amantichitinum ursilacus]|uniref:Zinc carboxypeptidase n=1 Tax=Amantichitinum ursilacus TaxID=857265 RepID=A0A0N0GMS3_9NEIS|nr:M14-type cytosolic carboxypeptidase [Amantichitinum ursilacus]KPC52041.1 Zinc carboxypeptidase [Amantichitinum ursilacus]
MLTISTAFDSGAIDVISLEDPSHIRLNLRADNAAPLRQWFHFRLAGTAFRECVMHIENAGQSAYPGGWTDYAARASYDGVEWFTVPTSYENGVLTIRHQPQRDSVYYAYFEPYSFERHLQTLGHAQVTGEAVVQELGQTVDGRPLDLLRVGTPDAGKKKIWIIARQHPGETMAEWFAEGLVSALLDPHHAVARKLLTEAVFYIVPNMNPDGSVRGNLRTNAAGTNLNRAWFAPSIETSPEVLLVRDAMEQTGVDAFLDVHGDESIPHNFVAGCQDNPSFSERQRTLSATFKAAWLAASPDFQVEHGYGDGRFGPETLTMATNWVGDRFDCLAFTIEMPFKDTANLPVPDVGWNGERSAQFGVSVLTPLLAVVRDLR